MFEFMLVCIFAAETDFATISITFCDEQTAKNFYSCWSDVLPLYRSRYPTCKLLFEEKTLISWKLRIYGNKVQDLSSFVTDLFSTVRIQEMVQRSPVTVNVIIPKSVSELIPSLPWEQGILIFDAPFFNNYNFYKTQNISSCIVKYPYKLVLSLSYFWSIVWGIENMLIKQWKHFN